MSAISVLNKAQTRMFVLEYANKRRPGKFIQIAESFTLRIESICRSVMRHAVDDRPLEYAVELGKDNRLDPLPPILNKKHTRRLVLDYAKEHRPGAFTQYDEFFTRVLLLCATAIMREVDQHPTLGRTLK